MCFILLDQAGEERLRIFLVYDLNFGLDFRGLVDRAPEGERLVGLGVTGVPGFLREVQSQVAAGLRVRKERGEEGLSIIKVLFGDGALMGTGFDVP
ncbi:MAG: hypothetical protein VX633_12385 [Verrucomicrobiota bacterium]|nr:hypothetical protein [Verrucomicrobiota bacterium]